MRTDWEEAYVSTFEIEAGDVIDYGDELITLTSVNVEPYTYDHDGEPFRWEWDVRGLKEDGETWFSSGAAGCVAEDLPHWNKVLG